MMVVAAAAISGGGERDDRRGPTAGRGGSRGGEARKLYSLNRWKGFDTASSGDDGPCSGAAFRRRGTTEWRGTVRSLLLSLSFSRAVTRSSSCPPPRPSLGRPTSPRDPLTLPASRHVPLNARCAVMHRAGSGIASASHKVCSCREYELPLPNQYHSSKKKGEKERKEKKRRLGTYNCRTSAITVSALCPRSCRRSPAREHRRRRLLPPSLPPPPPGSLRRLHHHFLHLSRVPTPFLAWG